MTERKMVKCVGFRHPDGRPMSLEQYEKEWRLWWIKKVQNKLGDQDAKKEIHKGRDQSNHS